MPCDFCKTSVPVVACALAHSPLCTQTLQFSEKTARTKLRDRCNNGRAKNGFTNDCKGNLKRKVR